MEQQAIIQSFVERAKALNVPITTVCERAGVHPTTFHRWKQSERNTKPVGMTFASMAAIQNALDSMEQGKAA